MSYYDCKTTSNYYCIVTPDVFANVGSIVYNFLSYLHEMYESRDEFTGGAVTMLVVQ